MTSSPTLHLTISQSPLYQSFSNTFLHIITYFLVSQAYPMIIPHPPMWVPIGVLNTHGCPSMATESN